jgi:hypothetical protein
VPAGVWVGGSTADVALEAVSALLSSLARITTAAAVAIRAAIAMMSSVRTRLKWERRTTDGCWAGIGCPMTASCVRGGRFGGRPVD